MNQSHLLSWHKPYEISLTSKKNLFSQLMPTKGEKQYLHPCLQVCVKNYCSVTGMQDGCQNDPVTVKGSNMSLKSNSFISRTHGTELQQYKKKHTEKRTYSLYNATYMYKKSKQSTCRVNLGTR